MIGENVSISHSMQAVNQVTLNDGRRLAYTEFGVPEGKPVIYHHGHPGSRMDLGMFAAEELARSGLRLIAVDRPGIGMSDFQPGRRIVDWPADVLELAGALGIERFAVLGVSGGGPFAAAVAHRLPDRVTKLALVSSVGQFDVPGATQGMGPGLMYFRLGRYFPWLSRLQLRMMAYGLKSGPEKMAAQVKTGLPPADIAAIDNPGMIDAFLLTLTVFLRQGSRGPAWEAGLFMRPWGFALEEIRVPTYLWHGEADHNAPLVMGRNIASRIPGCVAKFVPGEGHFSLIKNYLKEVLTRLAA